MIKSPLKFPGSKWRIAEWIVQHMPPHDFYLEPFFGSGAVLFSKPESALETINDIDGNVVNFFRVCRDHPEELARLLYLTPFSRAEFASIQEDAAGEPLHLTGDSIEDARRFAVRCWQGTGNKLGQRVGWKHDVTQSKGLSCNQWTVLPERIAPVAERLRRVQIECKDAVRLIREHNSPQTLIYADPPYLAEVRGSSIYAHEMGSRDEHLRLLQALLDHPGPVILSGYENELYSEALAGWTKDTITARAQSNAERLEVIWCNFDLQMSFDDYMEEC